VASPERALEARFFLVRDGLQSVAAATDKPGEVPVGRPSPPRKRDLRTSVVPAGECASARHDLYLKCGIHFLINVEECTQEWACLVEIPP